LLSTDASLDDGAVPDVIDSSINMTGHEVRPSRHRQVSRANAFRVKGVVPQEPKLFWSLPLPPISTNGDQIGRFFTN
jgi:hypothetical protein